MKRFGNILINHLLLLCSIAIIFSLGSCSQKKDNSEVTTYEGKNSSDTVPQETIKDTQTTSTEVAEPTTKEETTTTPTAKKCDPNFNLLSNPKKNQHIFYVSGFNPDESKCWVELEKQGFSVCGDRPCVIYYLDKANVAITSTPPHYVDVNILKTHGIGRFEHNGSWWELRGSKIWDRPGKGYEYYNSNRY